MAIRSDGHFEEDVKIPWVIQVGEELRLVEPGEHHFALILDESHATFAPFEVTALPPLSTATPAPTLSFQAFWLADSANGWLTADRCQGELAPTPDAYGNIPSPAPPACQGLIYLTTDGGQTWQEQYRGDVHVRALQFDGLQRGLAIGPEGYDCGNQTCPSAVLATSDGGLHWVKTFSTTFRLTNLAYTANDAWLLAKDCAQPPRDCRWYLLKSGDGGQTWNQSTLPVEGFSVDLSRPTAADGWIVSSWAGQGTAQIMATHNDGQTWNLLPHPEGGAGDVQFIFLRTAEDGWLLVGGQPGAGQQPKELFSTTDSGMSWMHLSGTLSLGGTTGAGELGWDGYTGPMVFSSDRDGWIASGRVGLIHSSDGGQHWNLSFLDDTLGTVQFTDPEHGWVVGLRSLRATTDGGATWQALPVPTAKSP